MLHFAVKKRATFLWKWPFAFDGDHGPTALFFNSSAIVIVSQISMEKSAKALCAAFNVDDDRANISHTYRKGVLCEVSNQATQISTCPLDCQQVQGACGKTTEKNIMGTSLGCDFMHPSVATTVTFMDNDDPSVHHFVSK